MQRAISILLIFCLIVQTFNRLSIITAYQLNKDFITEAFCINQSKPELHCEGKCYLNKQLAQADKQEKSAATHVQVKFEILFFQDIFSLPVLQAACLLSYFCIYLHPAFSSPVFDFFNPPKL